MNECIASAKPNSRVIRIGNRYIINTTIIVRRMKQYDIMRSLVRSHYRTAIAYNKKNIKRIFYSAGLPVPAYKDSQITDIIMLIREMSKKDSVEIAQAIIHKFSL